MISMIQKLWDEGLLPISDGIFFADDSAISFAIKYYPRPHIIPGKSFSLGEFLQHSPDELTSIDTIAELQLSNGNYCCVGEGSHGSEGFIAYLNNDRGVVWIIYSEQSNPFDSIVECGKDEVLVRSTAQFGLRIAVGAPDRLTIEQ